MAMTERAVVCDAGPIIHLDELQCIDLLIDLAPAIVPEEVWAEVATHRPALHSTTIRGLTIVKVEAPPSARLVAITKSLALDLGERAALRLLESNPNAIFACDDAAARLAAESMGFPARGTVGFLIRSMRRGLRSREQILNLLKSIPTASTLHLSRKLLDQVIDEVSRFGG
jgi:predicted nucleic acid-binding protein